MLLSQVVQDSFKKIRLDKLRKIMGENLTHIDIREIFKGETGKNRIMYRTL